MDNNNPIVNEESNLDIIKSTTLPNLNHQAILTAIDLQLDQDKNNLVKQLNTQQIRQEQIERIAKELKVDIKNLTHTIQGILEKHHKDYVKTFIAFMDTARNDLRKKIEQMKQVEMEKERLNDTNIIRCERDFFRMQSYKLNQSNTEYKDKLHDINIKMTILKDEVSSVTIKWSESEKVNQQLMMELEAALRAKNMIEKELDAYKVILKEMNDIGKNKEDINKEPEGLESIKEKSYIMIERLRLDLKREKLRNHRSMSEISNMYQEKNRLENIFVDCVEETRKMIYNRRVKGNIMLRGKLASLEGNTIKYDSFLPPDKMKIIERFVFNTEVCGMIHEMLFPKSMGDSYGETSFNNNNTNSRINARRYNRNNNQHSFMNQQSNFNTNNVFDQITLFNPIEEQEIGKTIISNDTNQFPNFSKNRKTVISFKGKTHSLKILMPIKSNKQ